jgi:autotransporter-associated beta strand protein
MAGNNPCYASFQTTAATGPGLQLAANTTINGTGMGNLLISSQITETGGPRSLTISGASPTHLSRIISLGNNANTFTGGLIIDGGTLGFAGFGAGEFGPVGSTLTVTSNGGELYVGGSNTSGLNVSTIQLNGRLRVLGSNSVLSLLENGTAATPWNNYLSGAGELLVNNSAVGALNIQSASTGYTGVVTMDRFDLPNVTSGAGGVSLSTTAGSSATNSSGGGALRNAAGINIRSGCTLTIQNSTTGVTQNLNRVSDTAPISMESGVINLAGPSSGTLSLVNQTELVGPVTSSGYSTFSASPGTGTTVSTTFTMASLARDQKGTFLFRGLSLGAGTANSGNVTFTSAPTADLVGGGGGAGSSTISILPYAIGDITNTGTGSSLVTLGATGVRPLATTEYAANLTSGTSTNARLTAATANAGTQTVNALVLANSTTDGSVTGTGTLNVTSGVILSNTAAATSIANNVNFGSAEGLIYTPVPLTISGQLTGSGGLTKSGGSSSGNTLFLTNDNSGLTGTLTINAGKIDISQASALPGTGTIVANGSIVGTTGNAAALNYSGATPMTLSRDIADNGGWFTLKTTVSGGTLTCASQISGAGALAVQPGTGADIYLTNANTYTGPTNISSGVAHISSDANLGNGGAVSFGSGGSLTLEGDWTTSRHVNFEVPAIGINTNGHNATLNGPMTSQAVNNVVITAAASTAGFAKNGLGTLTINSNSNTVTGAITVNGGTLLVNGSIGASATNAITVNTGAILGGSGTIWRNITVASGGTLSPGNSPGILTESGNLSLATGANFAIDLNGPAAGNTLSSYDQMVVGGTVSLNGGTGAGATLAPSLGYFPSFFDVFFVLTNDGTDAITGTFNGLPEGSTVSLGTWAGTPVTATISYLGNSDTGATFGGNDVVLYNIVPAPGTAALIGLSGLLATRRRRVR